MWATQNPHDSNKTHIELKFLFSFILKFFFNCLIYIVLWKGVIFINAYFPNNFTNQFLQLNVSCVLLFYFICMSIPLLPIRLHYYYVRYSFKLAVCYARSYKRSGFKEKHTNSGWKHYGASIVVVLLKIQSLSLAQRHCMNSGSCSTMYPRIMCNLWWWWWHCIFKTQLIGITIEMWP